MARGFVEPTIQPSYRRSQDIWFELRDSATLRDSLSWGAQGWKDGPQD
jgi:hypothetical protein